MAVSLPRYCLVAPGLLFGICNLSLWAIIQNKWLCSPKTDLSTEPNILILSNWIGTLQILWHKKKISHLLCIYFDISSKYHTDKELLLFVSFCLTHMPVFIYLFYLELVFVILTKLGIALPPLSLPDRQMPLKYKWDIF